MSRATLITFFLVWVSFFCQCIQVDNAFAAKEETSYQLYLPAIIGNISLVCPSGPTRFVLVTDHTWTWSPGGQVTAGLIQGGTTSGSCAIWVAGDIATGEDCRITYSNSGNIGSCQLSGQSTAMLSFEGSCSKGKISLHITEIQDPDAGMDGMLACPEVTEPYPTFYPPSLTTGTFFIDTEGETVNESKTDQAGYSYSRAWTIMPESAIP